MAQPIFDPHPLGAFGTLLADITVGATSLVLGAGQSSRFTNPSAGQYNATIVAAGQNPIFTGASANAERVRLTALSGSTFTITRAREGSSARAFLATDWIYAADGPTDYQNIEQYFTGTLEAWGDSTSLTEDKGGRGRLRLSRSGYVFAGASYNKPARAGTILQIGDYPNTADGTGAGNTVGDANSMVFLTMNDMPSQVGGGSEDDWVMFHIVGKNTTDHPYAFGQNVWMENSPGVVGEVFGYEVDIINVSGTPGQGRAFLASGNRNVTSPAVPTAAGAAFEATSGGDGANKVGNWTTGLKLNAIVAAGSFIKMADDLSSHATVDTLIDTTNVTGAQNVAAFWIGNNQGWRWANADGSGGSLLRHNTSNVLQVEAGAGEEIDILSSGGTVKAKFKTTTDLATFQLANAKALSWLNADATAGVSLRQQSDDNIAFVPTKSSTQYYFEDSGAHTILQVNSGAPSSLNTALLVAYHNGSSVLYGKQVSVRAAVTKRIPLGLPRSGTDVQTVLGGFGADNHQAFADGADVFAFFNNVVVPDNPGTGWVLKFKWSSHANDSGKNVVVQLQAHVYKDADTGPDSLGNSATAYPAASAADKIKVTSIALSAPPTAAGTLTTVLYFNRTAVGDDATGSVALWDAWYEYTEETGGAGFMSLILPTS